MNNNSRTEITKDNAVKILRSNFDKIPKHRYFDTTNCCLSNTSKLLIKCTEKIIQFLMDSHVITRHERANYIFPILKKCQFYYKEYTNF